jgi:DNA-binding Lrp family transcriptional regulator
MSAGAFVLIAAESGSEPQIVKMLKSIPCVKEVDVVFGFYDIVARIEADSIDRVRDVIMHKLVMLDNVRATEIMLGAKPQ